MAERRRAARAGLSRQREAKKLAALSTPLNCDYNARKFNPAALIAAVCFSAKYKRLRCIARLESSVGAAAFPRIFLFSFRSPQ